ncbi:MAG: hypothetical protein ABJD66_16280 [Cellulophaga sp.]|uniref:hypothetical protein n=1 Tax=unclassified Cellulophaga TaxID=2634405 RepID=UPI000C2C5C35|nr:MULTISPECIES: hypothetical protein [unclassified Cellulophaga]MDO6490295.1 hypothetical protein [Cellulophaga sp. 2_MG-2023]MDO6494511.1 hypothetical protein [Cellulophaga sp. 3_MG-2023]
MKKTFVMVVLFILPIVAYLFFASGIHNFGRLPILTNNVGELSSFSTDTQLKNKISIVGFLGDNVEQKKGTAFNLNQKIYKHFFEFKDFQFVMLVANGQEKEVEKLKKELSVLADIKNWKFVYGNADQIKSFHKELRTDITLEDDLSSPYVFIVDKDLNLRGRTDDEDEGTKYGFNTISVAELNNKMEDDVKIILAEYRMALKKNNAERK